MYLILWCSIGNYASKIEKQKCVKLPVNYENHNVKLLWVLFDPSIPIFKSLIDVNSIDVHQFTNLPFFKVKYRHFLKLKFT